jgi:hypothetical protein
MYLAVRSYDTDHELKIPDSVYNSIEPLTIIHGTSLQLD